MGEFTISAGVEPVEFEWDDDTFIVKQVHVNIFGHDVYLDPDQALSLWQELGYALDQLEEN